MTGPGLRKTEGLPFYEDQVPPGDRPGPLRSEGPDEGERVERGGRVAEGPRRLALQLGDLNADGGHFGERGVALSPDGPELVILLGGLIEVSLGLVEGGQAKPAERVDQGPLPVLRH